MAEYNGPWRHVLARSVLGKGFLTMTNHRIRFPWEKGLWAPWILSLKSSKLDHWKDNLCFLDPWRGSKLKTGLCAIKIHMLFFFPFSLEINKYF